MTWLALAIIAIGVAVFANAQYRSKHLIRAVLMAFAGAVAIFFGLVLFVIGVFLQL